MWGKHGIHLTDRNNGLCINEHHMAFRIHKNLIDNRSEFYLSQRWEDWAGGGFGYYTTKIWILWTTPLISPLKRLCQDDHKVVPCKGQRWRRKRGKMDWGESGRRSERGRKENEEKVTLAILITYCFLKQKH